MANNNQQKTGVLIGINWEQNSTACLMINGRVIGCSSEERFSRIKNDERYPKKAIDYLLKEHSIHKDQIKKICVISKQWSPIYSLIRHYTKFSIEDYIKEQNEIWYPRIFKKKKVSFLKVFKKKIDFDQFPGKKYWVNVVKQINKNDKLNNKNKILEYGKKIRSDVIFRHLGITRKNIEFIDHSFGHAAYAYCSGLNNGKKSMVFTIDAWGDDVNYSCYKFHKIGQKIIAKKISSGGDFIIGRLYRYVTLLLGFKPNEHEYKLMGMAPYSKEHYYNKLLKNFHKMQEVRKLKFKFLRKPKDMYFTIKKIIDGKRFDVICGALQKYTENLLLKWINNCLSNSRLNNICLAGGVAMNVKANLEISKLKKVKNIYVPPSPDDSSQAMGACYAYSILNNLPVHKISNAYLGYEIKNNTLKYLDKKKLKNYKIYKKNINKIAAKYLNKDKILCRAVGKSEFGARSLGNRSILASPSKIEVKKAINEKVKGRDFWMPFAASAIDKYSKDYFKLNSKDLTYKYMTNCVETKVLGRQKLKAAIHPYDKTCRPQIVSKKDNPEYYDLINEFGKLSKTYSLLNTSFNIHGKPIINNNQDAFKVFEETDLDGIIYPDLLIIKVKKN